MSANDMGSHHCVARWFSSNTSDSLVPIEQSQRFVDAARGAGDRTELLTFDGEHFDPITVGTPGWDIWVDAVRGLFGAP